VAIVVVDDGGGVSDEMARCGDAAMCFVITPAGMVCRAIIRQTYNGCLVQWSCYDFVTYVISNEVRGSNLYCAVFVNLY
jgi:hypothetical protein